MSEQKSSVSIADDKALLRLAARAAGIEIDKSPNNGGGIGNDGFDIMGNVILDWHRFKKWNPLTDDGDALRLAVRLDLRIYTHCNNESACAEDIQHRCPPQIVEWNGDKYAASRRAIVRAAAEIGKSRATEKRDFEVLDKDANWLK